MLLENKKQLMKIIKLDYLLCDCQVFVQDKEFINLSNRMIEIIRSDNIEE